MQVYQKMIIAASLAIGWTELSAVTVSMVPGTSYQNIEGFGGGVVYYQSWATLQDSAVREAIFDTAFTGLGLSIMRMGNWMQNESEGAAVQYDTVVYNALKARRPNAKIFMSSWSAPDSIKANATVNGNGDSRSLNTLDKDSAGNFKYASFAHWWRETYEAYVALGITPDYISIQNEPDMNATYASTILDSVESDSIANYAAAFQA
ncbi:MAG TPA: hypothetical protein VLM37_10190, partial [Fibrobacteraceae bacterium]|nr:hypothetical protein [Fibrobacteraceae bacterium]